MNESVPAEPVPGKEQSRLPSSDVFVPLNCTFYNIALRRHALRMNTRRRRPPRPGALSDLSPLRILRQILVLQLAYYVVAVVLIVFIALVAGKPLSLDLLLSWRLIRGDVTDGWMLGLCWMLDSLVRYAATSPARSIPLTLARFSVVFLMLLIARSKLVLDFAVTVHVIHLLVTSLYSHSFPTHILWWALQVTSSALMTSLGIWACQWRELKPINFGNSQNDGDGVGFQIGHGRGAGRDGAGSYEMVSVGDEG